MEFFARFFFCYEIFFEIFIPIKPIISIRILAENKHPEIIPTIQL